MDLYHYGAIAFKAKDLQNEWNAMGGVGAGFSKHPLDAVCVKKNKNIKSKRSLWTFYKSFQNTATSSLP